MVYFEWPLYQGAILWSSVLFNWFTGHGPEFKSYKYQSEPVSIHDLYDNVATKNFDGWGRHYPIELLPTGTFSSENVNFTLPHWGVDRPDNVIADGQVVSLVPKIIREFHLLYAGDWIDGESGERFLFEFADGTTQSVECSVKNWWNLHWLNSGPIRLPYHKTPEGIDYNITQIHHWSTPVNSHSPLQRIRFPGATNWNHLHIFAISVVPSLPHPPSVDSSDSNSRAMGRKGHSSPALAVKDLKMTTRFVEWGDHRGHSVVEVTIANLAPAVRKGQLYTGFLDGDYTVHVVGEGISTSVPGRIRRLMPSDDARLDIGIKSEERDTAKGYSVRVHLYDRAGHLVMKSEEWDLVTHSGVYDASKESLDKHETPRWWRNAKFGIFIHWGVYSVPGWVPKGYYEEWYHWWIHNPAQPSNVLWNYHLNTYGKHVAYDDFIANFTGAKFNADQWVDLFASAGAKYFVLVTKHHDGFALFDTGNTTHRSSVHLGPRRDFLDELMIAAKTRHPDMKRGTYYSMPEWFNPAAKEYGFGNWPGGLARNAFDPSKLEPYTGHLEGKDYLKDIQQAHMQILVERYDTDIMWCDIGGPNRTAEFAAKWYNDAREAGRHVTINNRCGVAPDFDTPEYARFSSVQTRSWETNEGIDPFSYGYNRQTNDDEYRSAEAIVHSIVDIVSKNGNYLLNLGPNGEGEIIPPMIERLVEVGQWLGHSGDCIYNTTYSFPGAEEDNLRFTTTTDTFCIISLERPETALIDEDGEFVRQSEAPQKALKESAFALAVVERPLPVFQHDKVFLLGGSGKELKVRWKKDKMEKGRLKKGRMEILVPLAELDMVKHAWAFQVHYA